MNIKKHKLAKIKETRKEGRKDEQEERRKEGRKEGRKQKEEKEGRKEGRKQKEGRREGRKEAKEQKSKRKMKVEQFANGWGGPKPRTFLSRASLLQSSLFETHHASIVFANGGELPQPPPLC